MTVGSTSRFAEPGRGRASAPLGRAARAGARAALLALVAVASSGCGVFATYKEHNTLAAKNDALAREVEREKQEVAQLRADLQATRDRLDNALRANADNGSDLMSEKARVSQMAGRFEEQSHALEEVKKELASTRSELDARLDDMKRAQEAQTPRAPVLTIPPDKGGHFGAVENAYAQRDWGLTRTLGREFINRYPTDDRADDVRFLIGDADLKDGRPSSALGEFNRILKLNPPSNVLDRTLFGMGEAYLLMHDCQNARLAFTSCSTRFPKAKVGQDAKQKIAAIDHPAPGMCAPP